MYREGNGRQVQKRTTSKARGDHTDRTCVFGQVLLLGVSSSLCDHHPAAERFALGNVNRSQGMSQRRHTHEKARKSKAAMSCRCRPPPWRSYQQDSPEGRHIMTGLSFLLKRISSRDIGCGDGSSGALSDRFYYPLQPRPTSSNIVIITSLNPPSFSINNPSK